MERFYTLLRKNKVQSHRANNTLRHPSPFKARIKFIYGLVIRTQSSKLQRKKEISFNTHPSSIQRRLVVIIRAASTVISFPLLENSPSTLIYVCMYVYIYIFIEIGFAVVIISIRNSSRIFFAQQPRRNKFLRYLPEYFPLPNRGKRGTCYRGTVSKNTGM